MRTSVKDLQQTQEASSVNVQPTKQATSVSSRLTKSQLIEDFAKKICKVKNFMYICIGKRCNKQQNSIHTEPHYSGVPETLSYLLRYCTFAKTQGASLLLFTYIN